MHNRFYLPNHLHILGIQYCPCQQKVGHHWANTDFRNLNQACSKENFITYFFDQVVNECTSHKVLSSIDGLFGDNQIHTCRHDDYKTALPHLGDVCLSRHALQTKELWSQVTAHHALCLPYL